MRLLVFEDQKRGENSRAVKRSSKGAASQVGGLEKTQSRATWDLRTRTAVSVLRNGTRPSNILEMRTFFSLTGSLLFDGTDINIVSI